MKSSTFVLAISIFMNLGIFASEDLSLIGAKVRIFNKENMVVEIGEKRIGSLYEKLNYENNLFQRTFKEKTEGLYCILELPEPTTRRLVLKRGKEFLIRGIRRENLETIYRYSAPTDTFKDFYPFSKSATDHVFNLVSESGNEIEMRCKKSVSLRTKVVRSIEFNRDIYQSSFLKDYLDSSMLEIEGRKVADEI